MHHLTKPRARRIAVRAQMLDAPLPKDLLEVVQRLTLLQIDPTAAIAPSADLVAWSRVGSAYEPTHLRQALEVDRTLFEHNAFVRPTGDLGLVLAGTADWLTHERSRAWLRDNDSFRRDVLALLADSGPLTSRDIPDAAVVSWSSTGWTNDRNVTQMLEFLMMRCEIGDRRTRRARATVGSGGAGLPARRRRPIVRGGPSDGGRAAARRVRHRSGKRAPRCRSSRSTSATPASRPSWRG